MLLKPETMACYICSDSTDDSQGIQSGNHDGKKYYPVLADLTEFFWLLDACSLQV